MKLLSAMKLFPCTKVKVEPRRSCFRPGLIEIRPLRTSGLLTQVAWCKSLAELELLGDRLVPGYVRILEVIQ